MMLNNRFSKYIISLLFLNFGFLSLASSTENRPIFLGDTVVKHYYDGKTDDLLTAGWQVEELSLRKNPLTGDSKDPRWIRRVAYYNNIIALLDTTKAGGYGSIYGPASTQKTIPGYEYISYSLDNKGLLDATLMLQIPDNMNTEQPCLIVTASSGSRGIYGAVGTVGSWALLNSCAIAYTDKGTGTGFYFFDTNKGYDIEGRHTKNSDANPLIYYPPESSKSNIFLRKHPTAIAVKQAYSGKNVEKDFGLYVIQAGEFALYQINLHFEKNKVKLPKGAFTKENTIIIAASVSNGGEASLKAGEQDSSNLFDAIVVAEPNITPIMNNHLEIVQGNVAAIKHSLSAYDYFASINLYSPCSLLTKQARNAPFFSASQPAIKYLESWCEQLKLDGYLEGDSIATLSNNALGQLNQLGLYENSQTLAPLAQLIKLWPALATTYGNQLGRYSLEDNICGVYFSAIGTDGNKTMLGKDIRESLFATSNGIPPTAGVQLVSTQKITSPYVQAKCFYELSKEDRIRNGISELVSTNRLVDIPTIILHGRNDQLIAPNHTSRPYYANALKLNTSSAAIRYYEITNAQHFDAFNSLPQFSDQYIPLHYYFEQALDLMMKHLTNGASLPPSQVVHTIKRNKLVNTVEPLHKRHLPFIEQNSKSLIKLVTDIKNGDTLVIPD